MTSRRTALWATALLVLAACSSGGGSTSSSRTPTPTASPTPSATASPGATSVVSVYFVSGEKLQPVRRSATGVEVGAAAVRALLAGPSAAERAGGLSTAVPSGTTLLGLNIAAGLATVDLSGGYASGGGSLSMTSRVAEVVFTLTHFPTVQRVTFRLDGQPVTALGGEGVDLSRPVTRADYEDLSPAVLVESPRWAETATLPLRVAGTANVFEAVFFLELKDASGRGVANKRVMATAGTGTRGTFSTLLDGTATPGAGRLTAYTLSAKDGSRHDEMSLPVTLG